MTLIVILVYIVILIPIVPMAKEDVVYAKRVKSTHKKETQTSILANAVNMDVPILVLLKVMNVTMLVPHAVAVRSAMAKSVSHARCMESAVVMMNAVMAMVAIIMAKSFTLKDRSVTQIQIVFAILNAITV